MRVRNTGLALLLGLCGFAGGLAAEVVWSGLDEGAWRIYLGSSPGSALEAAGFPPGSDFGAPALSPDGSRVAIEVAGQGVAVCPLPGGACTRLEGVPGVAVRPAWNQETGELVFAVYRVDAEREESDLWVAGPDLENPRPLVVQTANLDDPAVSPDGRALVYSASQSMLLRRAAARLVRRLWIMDLVTGEPRPLSAGTFQDLHPAWSPDGGRIAFASDRGGRFEIWVVDAAGGEPRQVTAGPGPKTWPAWSPDGRRLLFTWYRHGRHDLVTVDADASKAEVFAPLLPAAGAPRRDADWR